MKKVVIFLFLCLLTYALQAQETETLRRIQAASAQMESLDAKLTNTNTKPRKQVVREGNFYYQSPDKFAAYFDNSELMVVNDNHLKIDIGMFHGTFKMGKSGILRKLSNLFLYALQGKCDTLAEENNYDLSIEETDEGIAVTLTSRKKSFFKIGYEKAIFLYDSESLLLNEIRLFDSRGTQDFYQMTEPQYNSPIEEVKFET